jgi:glycosyltransferase involved in cell wall biosynthesis
MKPLVTVGICVRNGEKMLSTAIDSVLNQNFPQDQLQIIIVDAGSKDNTPAIIAKYAKKLGSRAKCFCTSWRGLGHARNFIVNNADGEFIVFVDSDEVLTPSYVKTQVETLQHFPNVGVTAGIFKIVPDNLILNLEIVPYIVNQRNYLKPRNFIWKTDKLIGTGGTTFRLEALQQVHGFDERISGSSEDTDLVLRVKHAGWQIRPNTAEFYELHGGLSKPEELWKKYFWYGYGSQRTFNRTREAFSLPRMSPPAGLVAGVFYSFQAYRFLRLKQVFLLPLHYGFKLTAWMFGFMKGQMQDLSRK